MACSVHFSGEGLGPDLFDEDVVVDLDSDEVQEGTTVADLKEKLVEKYPSLAPHSLLCFSTKVGSGSADLIDKRSVLSYLDRPDRGQASLSITVQYRMMALPVTHLIIKGCNYHSCEDEDDEDDEEDEQRTHIVMVPSNSSVHDLTKELANGNRNVWCSLSEKQMRIYGPGSDKLSRSSDLLRDCGAFEEGSGGVVLLEKRESEGGAHGKKHAEKVSTFRKWACTEMTIDTSAYEAMFEHFPKDIADEVNQVKPQEGSGQEAGAVLKGCLATVTALPTNVCPELIKIVTDALNDMFKLLDATERADEATECIEILETLKEELVKLSSWRFFSYPRDQLKDDYEFAELALSELINVRMKNSNVKSKEEHNELIDDASKLKKTLDDLTKHWAEVLIFEPTSDTMTRVADQEKLSAERLGALLTRVKTEVKDITARLHHLSSTEKACLSFHTEGLKVLKECKSVVECESNLVESEIEDIEEQIRRLEELKEQKENELTAFEKKTNELDRAYDRIVSIRNSFVSNLEDANLKCTVKKAQSETTIEAISILLKAAPLLANNMHNALLERVRHAREMKTNLAADSTLVFNAHHRSLYLEYLAKDGALSYSLTKKGDIEANEIRLRPLAAYDDTMAEEYRKCEEELETWKKKIQALEKEIDTIKALQQAAEQAHTPMWSFLIGEGWVEGAGMKARVRDSMGNQTLTGFGVPGLKLTLPYEEEETINQAAAEAFNGQVKRLEEVEATQLQQRGIAARASSFFRRLTGGNADD